VDVTGQLFHARFIRPPTTPSCRFSTLPARTSFGNAAASRMAAPELHFCYSSGVHREEFVKWLEKENVVCATTGDAGLADRRDNPLLLPRFVDAFGRSQLEFEWLSGVGSLLALRKAAKQRYVLRPRIEAGPPERECHLSRSNRDWEERPSPADERVKPKVVRP
jgi:hypothetical protein